MKLLSSDEIAQGNRLLKQAGDLLNARGHGTDGLAIYEAEPFRVTWQGDEDSLIIRIFARGQEVMWSSQDTPDGPGKLFITPGTWQADFLSLPAAHA